MLINYIHKFETPMQELVQYLKHIKIDINTFFTKLDLPYQYIIIHQYLLIKYNIVMSITPNVMGIRHYKYNDGTENPIIYASKIEDIQQDLNNCYIKLIVEAFKYIEKTPF